VSASVLLPVVPREARPPRLSLRARGMLALGLLVVYVASAALFLASERRELFITAQQIESHRLAQEVLAPGFNTLAHTLVQTQSILSAADYSDGVHATYADIGASLGPLMARLQQVRDFDPSLGPRVDELQFAVDAVRAEPSGRHLSLVRNAEQQMIVGLNDLLLSLQHRSEVLAEQYHDQQQRVSITAVGTSIVGALASAAVILVFFTRLARDIGRLQDRAAAIVSGYSGPPLVNRRRDEIGGLIDAVNRMQADLRRWEQQQEIGRQQRFHQEKMAAVGSMAAAIGHEVSNPIAAIAGVAQFLIDETKGDGQRVSRLAHDFSVQILRQTERISLIMRQLANLTRPHSPEPELLDLNALVQSTGSFIAFDKRFRGIEFEYRLDHDLPAVTAVADHMTQVFMNLLINAADAMEHVVAECRARIQVSTAVANGEIRLDVSDTGHGMTPEVMARAFEESFTTKPAGKGRGIGLFLCKTLVEQAGGRIELASTPGEGTTVSLFLPLAQREQAEG
jgi:two-component system, NtrC family, sensor kinase